MHLCFVGGSGARRFGARATPGPCQRRTSILETLAAPSRCCIRFRMVSAARSISPAQRGSRARTGSTWPVSVTGADRAIAGPTATVQANVVRAGEAGWRRMTSATTPVAKFCSGTIGDTSDTIKRMRLILASASPRRAELLSAAGFTFDVQPADVDETPGPSENPTDYVLRVARD